MPHKAIVNLGEAYVWKKRPRPGGVTIIEEENTEENEVPLQHRRRFSSHFFGQPQTTPKTATPQLRLEEDLVPSNSSL